MQNKTLCVCGMCVECQGCVLSDSLLFLDLMLGVRRCCLFCQVLTNRPAFGISPLPPIINPVMLWWCALRKVLTGAISKSIWKRKKKILFTHRLLSFFHVSQAQPSANWTTWSAMPHIMQKKERKIPKQVNTANNNSNTVRQVLVIRLESFFCVFLREELYI